MIRSEGPTCPGCGGPPARGSLMCTGCWAEVPTPARQELKRAWKAYAAQPGSLRRRHEYEVAIAAAVGSIP